MRKRSIDASIKTVRPFGFANIFLFCDSAGHTFGTALREYGKVQKIFE